MNYYAAREINGPDGKGTGKWHYTRRNKRLGTFPVGYCAEGCEGHDTPEGAYEHQTAYLLDRETRLDGESSGQMLRCRVCQEWTSRFAQVGESRLYMLCDQHRNRDEVAKLLGIVGDEISS